MSSVQHRLIVALDLPSRCEADALASQLSPQVSWFKIGLELFSAEGPALVRDYAGAGRRVFLDLKLHDIPATVARATACLAGLGASMLTVHASGGSAMMEAAARAAKEASPKGHERLRVLAVTALTSLSQDDLSAIGVTLSMDELVRKRALLAAAAGCDGVVASPWEAKLLRGCIPEDFLVVTPGIRPEGCGRGDQKRVMTPRQAIDAGADMIVVGRPVRDASDPALAARAIIQELAEETSGETRGEIMETKK